MITEPTIITEGLPEGYRIICDEQDHRYYPQRTRDANGGGFRFATRKDLGGAHIDKPLAFPQIGKAKALIAHDANHFREASWGSIVYSPAELRACLKFDTSGVKSSMPSSI